MFRGLEAWIAYSRMDYVSAAITAHNGFWHSVQISRNAAEIAERKGKNRL